MTLRINLSTALCVLCSCLISLIFGITIGRSWGYAEAKNEKEQNQNQTQNEKKRIVKSKNQIPLLFISPPMELMDMPHMSSSGPYSSTHDVSSQPLMSPMAHKKSMKLLKLLNLTYSPHWRSIQQPAPTTLRPPPVIGS